MKTLSFHKVTIGRSPNKSLIEIHTPDDSIEFKPGINLLVAPNGYGKTSLFLTIAGLIQPLAGKIHLGEHPLQREKDLLYISEYLSFPKYIYPKEWIDFFSNAEPNDRLEEWTERLRITPLMKNYIGRMSQGERRKLTWLAAWQSDRDIFLFDEPLDGLDMLAVDQAREMLKAWKDKNKIICIVTHQVGDLLSLCDHVVFIKDRKLNPWSHFFSTPITETSADHFREEVLKIYSPGKM